MKQLLTLFSLCILTVVNAKTFYVSPDATGKGTSWEDSSGDLNAVLFAAEYGDEVWVAAGIYTPSFDNDRTVPFVIYKGVKVYGGFTGKEMNKFQRNWKRNKTILSGEIGTVDAQDNSFTVVYLKNADENTLLDGFTISDGCANQSGATAALQKSGGGLYNDGSGAEKSSNPIIRNCFFTNNYARDGAAVYNNGMKGGHADALFENCYFANNRADLDGGAFFNDGRRGGSSEPTLQKCTFTNNEANHGGALMNYGGAGLARPNLKNCQFTNNKSYLEGGAIFNMGIEGIAILDLRACQFEENSPNNIEDYKYKAKREECKISARTVGR